MPFLNRVRLPILFTEPQFPTERNVFRLADGSTKVQSVVIRNTYNGKTDQLPEDWHRKLVVALSHDTVTIENERLMSNVVLNSDYNIDHQDFLQYPIAAAGFTVEVTPFAATNSNCQTCEEMSQVSLVDDTTDEVWDEGTTHEFPDVLTDNDTICCFPYTIELVTYNTQFFDNVTISAGGVLTATVIDPAPIVSNVLIARYRVTCASGQYDEADVFGNISGTDSDFCYEPIGPLTESELSATSVLIDWDSVAPPPASWNWELYLTSDLGTIIDSGSVAISEVTLTGLNPFVSYTIFVISDCGGGNFSQPASLEFEITGFPATNCGNFAVESIDGDLAMVSYMDCAGDIQNYNFTYAQTINRCMLIIPGTTTPVYFTSTSPLVTINYVGLC